MATYKVIQDIEAEDKFVGPLTLKQFVFAMIGSFFAWVCFYLVTKQLGWALVIFAPLSFFGFFMAFPWSKEQPTDVWVLAKIRFYFKPKKRIWDQSGREDLVTITAPKKMEKHLTKDFSETEVKSRLKALADTIDSRGWAVKHATASDGFTNQVSTDRLIDTSILPQQVPDESYDIPDIMENSKVDNMISENDDKRRSQIAEKMDQLRQNNTAGSKESEAIIAPPEDSSPKVKNTADRIDEMLLSDKIKASRAAKNAANSKLPTIAATKTSASKRKIDDNDKDDAKTHKSKAKNKPSKPDSEKSSSTMTEQISPDILNLARNNDLNVATIARQANDDKLNDGDEVVVSLH